MKVAKTALYLMAGMSILTVGVYFYVFGFYRGARLARIFLTEFDNSDRQQFLSFFKVRQTAITINEIKSKSEANVGVIVFIDTKNKILGLVDSKGVQFFKANARDKSFFFYAPFCAAKEKGYSPDFTPYSDFGPWIKSGVKRGTIIMVSYLEKDKDKFVIPMVNAKYSSGLPYATSWQQACLR